MARVLEERGVMPLFSNKNEKSVDNFHSSGFLMKK